MQSAEQPQPSLDLFIDTMGAYQKTEALKAAIKFDLMTAVGEGADTVSALARRCQASERGMRILCDFLAINGFLVKQDERYALSLDSAVFLDRRSPAYAGASVLFLASPVLTEGFRDLAEVVRRGGPSTAGMFSPQHPVWLDYARAMAPFAALPAELIARMLCADAVRPRKVLELAAGPGIFGITLAQHDPQVEIVAVDWPHVLGVSSENAEAAGISDRYHTIPGDAFEVEYGTGYDVVVIANFLHGFDRERCETLLKKAHSALNAGGKAIAVEFVPNQDRISPAVAASFSLMMLAMTAGGDAHTALELEEMFRKSGFSSVEIRPLSPTPHHAVVARK